MQIPEEILEWSTVSLWLTSSDTCVITLENICKNHCTLGNSFEY